jgi:acetyltransferase-like isoleucine patch superfamily enzyme
MKEIIDRIKLLVALCLPLIPWMVIKKFFYKSFLGYEIGKNVKIGFSFIYCEKVYIEDDVYIGHFNVIYNNQSFIMNKNSVIKKFNTFRNLKKITLEQGSVIVKNNIFMTTQNSTKFGNFYLGPNSVITLSHYFDLVDDIYIGGNTVIAGKDSQFWTHGFDILRNRIQGSIIIENNCYIGSRVLVNLGIKVISNTQVGMGTVISKSILEPYGFWVSQQLVRKSEHHELNESEDCYLLNELKKNKFFRKKD